MKQFGTLFFRSLLVLAILMLGVAAVMPQRASAMLDLVSDDFNRCTPDPMWVFEDNNISGATNEIVGSYTGDANLQLTLPAGVTASFSSSDVSAPRIMTEISDTSFTVEGRFTKANIASPDEDFVIQGLLFQDNTDPTNVEWFRFDFNARNGGLNTYAGYLRTDASGAYIPLSFRHIRNVTSIGSAGAYGNIRVNYVASSGQWTVEWMVGDPNTVDSSVTFNESLFGDGTLGGQISSDFDVTHVGFFVGNSGAGQPTSVALIDYFEVSPDDLTTADDTIVLNTSVSPANSGVINRTACNNTTVTLQAVPNSGFAFTSWTGVTGSTTNSTTTVNMTQSRNVVANFTVGNVTFDNFLYVPTINK